MVASKKTESEYLCKLIICFFVDIFPLHRPAIVSWERKRETHSVAWKGGGAIVWNTKKNKRYMIQTCFSSSIFKNKRETEWRTTEGYRGSVFSDLTGANNTLTYLRCVQGYWYYIWDPISLSFIVSEISAFILTIYWSLWALKWAWQTFFESIDWYWWGQYISIKIFILTPKL